MAIQCRSWLLSSITGKQSESAVHSPSSAAVIENSTQLVKPGDAFENTWLSARFWLHHRGTLYKNTADR